ncbi:hypothetical protein [Pantoea sp. C2G6]|uniref:hypothetical protein n=1 Tax=Pantoea sp. C2G6 TaxID=3243084 RepID=UPI003ED8EE52
MPDYHFYKKGKHVVAIERQEEHETLQYLQQGYEKQFEEIRSASQQDALKRFADIRKGDRIDQRNFLAGAGEMPLIGVLTAIATYLLTKKWS